MLDLWNFPGSSNWGAKGTDGVGFGEGVSPSQLAERSGEGTVPSPQKFFFSFLSQNDEFWLLWRINLSFSLSKSSKSTHGIGPSSLRFLVLCQFWILGGYYPPVPPGYAYVGRSSWWSFSPHYPSWRPARCLGNQDGLWSRQGLSRLCENDAHLDGPSREVWHVGLKATVTRHVKYKCCKLFYFTCNCNYRLSSTCVNVLIFLDPEGGSQNATLVVLVLVVGISSLKISKAFLIRNGAQRNFAYTVLLTLQASAFRVHSTFRTCLIDFCKIFYRLVFFTYFVINE